MWNSCQSLKFTITAIFQKFQKKKVRCAHPASAAPGHLSFAPQNKTLKDESPNAFPKCVTQDFEMQF